MTQLKLTLLAAVATLALSSPALAAKANKMTTICNSNSAFCVYDQGGHLLGISQQANIVDRQIGSDLWFAGYTANGLTVDLTLFYNSTDCSGQPLIEAGSIGPDGVTPVPPAPPGWAQWDGEHFWGPGGATEVTSPRSNVCYGVVCYGNPEGQCMPYGAIIAYGYPAYAPAKVIETPPTFTTCAESQSCVTIK